MPRGPVSAADAQLISALARRGVAVSPYQIEDWRQQLLVPRNIRHGRGRGRGSISILASDALPRAEMVGRAGPNSTSLVQYTADAMTGSYKLTVPVVRDLIYGALYQALKYEDATIQSRDDGTDMVSKAYDDAEAEFGTQPTHMDIPRE